MNVIPVPQPLTNIMAYLPSPNTGAPGQNYIASGSEIYDTLATLSPEGCALVIFMLGFPAPLRHRKTSDIAFVHCTCNQIA